MVKKSYVPMMAVTEKEKANSFNEEFKGQVFDKPIRFPKGLGAEHPFEFQDMEKVIYKSVGIVAGGVNKIVDKIVGDFRVKINDDNAQALVDSFIKESDLKESLKPWVKEGIGKGNGFMELDMKEDKTRVMNANNMYVKRTSKGKVKEYNQFTGDLNKFSTEKKNDKKMITFKPNQIAHLRINKVPNDPYGIGMVYPSERVIENIILKEQDLQKLLSRKAGAPIHVKLGVGQAAVQQSDIDDFKGKLQFMNNSTEWVTDGSVEMKPIDFSGIGDNLLKSIDHDIEMLAAGMEIPLVLFGKANVAEGLAKAQKATFDEKIKSIREEIEGIIEQKIFKPFLEKNGLNFDVEFIWDLPTEEDKNLRLTEIQKALNTFELSPTLRAALEIEYATILGLEDVADLLIQPKDADKAADDARKEQEKDLKQPEVPGVKPTAKQKSKVITQENDHEECCTELDEEELSNMTVREYANITEIPGFNYSDYLIAILRKLKVEKFDDLRAVTELDIQNGLLPSKDINKLNLILKDGFRRNKTMRQIESDIRSGINLKDRKIGEKITLASEKRPSVIARTEVVRLSNLGLKDMYRENGIDKYRYLAALDDRTSDICLSLSGRVFPISEGQPGINMPPMHINCRSTIVGLIE